MTSEDVAQRASRLGSLFRPRSIAMVGASDRPGSRGAELLDNLRTIGYAGTLFAVNPARSQVGDLPCYPSLVDLPEPPEMVAIGVSSDRVMDVVRAAAQVGSRAVSIVGAGYAESGADGTLLQDAIAALCREHGIALCGPNCLGVWSRLDRVAYWLAGGNALPLSGLGLVIQSGALASSIMDPLERRGIAFDVIATVGNEAGLTAGDYLGEMVGDPRVRAVAVVVEAIRDADRFLEAVEAGRQVGKPVFVMKLGRSESGRRAALAHTASVAGEHKVARAVLAEHGAVVVDDLDLLIEALVLARAHPAGLGPNVLYATVSGAGAGLVADLVSTAGLPLASLPDDVSARVADLMPGVQIANPLDVAMAGDRTGLFALCMEAAASSPNVDAVAVALNVPFATHPDGTRFYVEQVEALAAFRSVGKPAIAFTLTSGDLDPAVRSAAEALGVPLLMGAGEAVSAIASVRAPTPGAVKAAQHRSPVGILPPGGASVLDEVDSKRILGSWGLTTTREVVAGSADEAVAAAEELGYPVVLKAIAPGLVHKSDVGGVRLGVRSAADVCTAFEAIAASVAANGGHELAGVVVQEAVEDGLELLVGIKRDEVFGHVIVLGWGGIFVELLGGTSIRRVPIEREDARAMIDELGGSAILRGARGRRPADVIALADALVALSRFAQAAGDRLEAVDVNPILVLAAGKGAVAVDATIQMRAVDD